MTYTTLLYLAEFVPKTLNVPLLTIKSISIPYALN